MNILIQTILALDLGTNTGWAVLDLALIKNNQREE
jgi:hypothetical protein